jgi:hypothetical protein
VVKLLKLYGWVSTSFHDDIKHSVEDLTKQLNSIVLVKKEVGKGNDLKVIWIDKKSDDKGKISLTAIYESEES